MSKAFLLELDWARQQIPRLQKALTSIKDLKHVSLACSVHLDIKMIPLLEGLLSKGASIYLTTCNPHTVRDEISPRTKEQPQPGLHLLPKDVWTAALK